MEPLAIGALVGFGATGVLAAVFYSRAAAEKRRAVILASQAEAFAAQSRERELALAELRVRFSGVEESLRERSLELTKLQQDLNDGATALSDAKSLSAAATAARDALQRKFDERMKEYEARVTELEKARADHAALMKRCTDAEKTLASTDSAREEERRAFAERMEELKNLRKEMEASFAKLSGEALSRSSEQFLTIAGERLAKLNEQNSAELAKHQKAVEELVKPINEAMGKVGERVDAFDKNRAESFTQMAERITALARQEETLRKETAALGEALRKPSVRGAWGEMQLRRVVEFAGMVDHCHFEEQVAVSAADRPDMIIHLPNGVSIIVDAKAPMQSYLEALQVTDLAARAELMQGHVRQIRERVKKLGQKKYTENLKDTPDFTVLFLPAESLLSTALELDPTLLDDGMKDKILIATPTTLIALLLAVAAGWQNRTVMENARQLQEECKKLYDSVCSFLGHYGAVGAGLEKAIAAYNKSIGSMERTYLPKARRINELGGFDKEGKLLSVSPEEIVETNARQIDLPEVG
jgi:DNA recombination protein RmuC